MSVAEGIHIISHEQDHHEKAQVKVITFKHCDLAGIDAVLESGRQPVCTREDHAKCRARTG
jgi:hypothetical protein